MSLLGSLEDVSVSDVMQFVHLGGHSGTLHLVSGDEQAKIAFHRGRIVGAGTPSSKRLGEILSEQGMLSETDLADALREQAEEGPHRSLGKILMDKELVTQEEVREAVEKQVEHNVFEIVAWTHGSFEFVMNEMDPIDDISLHPGDLIPEVDLNTPIVLLEAARIFDERSRASQPGTELERPPSSKRSGAQPETNTQPFVQVVSQDDLLVERLRVSLAYDVQQLARVPLREAGSPPPGVSPPIVVIDLRQRATLEAIRTLRRARPRSPVIAIVDSSATSGEVFRAGAIAALPADAETVAIFVRSFARNCGDLPRALTSRSATEPRFAKLRRIFSDLRSGALSSTMALSLMTVIAESIERAVLLLVQGDSLVVLGSFGYAADLQPLSRATKGIRLSVKDDNAITRCLVDARARTVKFGEADLPPRLVELLGPPHSGQAAVFPVMGGQRVIAAIYADNARSNRAIEEVDILELAMMQVGLAFENELLRRKASARR